MKSGVGGRAAVGATHTRSHSTRPSGPLRCRVPVVGRAGVGGVCGLPSGWYPKCHKFPSYAIKFTTGFQIFDFECLLLPFGFRRKVKIRLCLRYR